MFAQQALQGAVMLYGSRGLLEMSVFLGACQRGRVQRREKEPAVYVSYVLEVWVVYH